MTTCDYSLLIKQLNLIEKYSIETIEHSDHFFVSYNEKITYYLLIHMKVTLLIKKNI